jgi:hypothetical protein
MNMIYLACRHGCSEAGAVVSWVVVEGWLIIRGDGLLKRQQPLAGVHVVVLVVY